MQSCCIGKQVREMSGSIIELRGGNQRAAAERIAEGIENNYRKYREGGKACMGIPGGSIEGKWKRTEKKAEKNKTRMPQVRNG